MNTVSMKAAILMAALFSVSLFSMHLYADELSVEDRLMKLERLDNSRNLVQIEMQQQIDALSNDVRQLRGSLEEANYKLQQATERQKGLYQELDKLKATPSATAPVGATTESSQAAGTPIVGQTPAPVAKAASAEETQAYDAAVSLVMKDKDFAKAIPAFEAFIQKYPQSSYVPNAHYWLGQLLYNQGDKDNAKANFLIVAQKFKDSPKRADAILKLGMITLSEGDKEKANKFFQLVVKQYPDTPSAQLAQKALNAK
jgi:tol-pal system protein YbgF